MAITLLPKDEGFGGRLGTALGTGLGDVLQGLVQGKVRQLQQQQFEKAGLPAILAYLDPKVQGAYLKQFGAAQQLAQRAPRLGERVANLMDINKEGSIDKTLGFFGGADADTYNLYAKELQKDISKVYPDAVVPTAKMDQQARTEGLLRLKERLEKDFGPQQAEEILEAPIRTRQAPQEQVPMATEQEESGLGQLLRTLAGSAAGAVAPLTALASPAAGAGIAGSDIVQALESYRKPILSEEEVADITSKMEPEKAEQFRKIYEEEKKSPFKISDYLPTTRNIKRLVGTILPDNYFEPRSKGEAFIQDAVNKGIGLVSFGGMGLGKAALATATGLGAREIAKEYGAGPLAQTTAELLFTMMPPVLFNKARENLGNTARDLYAKFDDSAAARQRIDIPEVVKEAKDLRKQAQKFESLSSNKQLVKTLENFEKELVGDKIKMADAVNAKKEIGRIIAEAPLDKTARGLLTSFNGKLKDALHSQGAGLDADGYQFLKKADEIWSGLRSGESIVDSLRNLIKQGKGRYRSLSMYNLVGRFPAGAAGAVAGRILPKVGYAKGGVAGLVGHELYQTYKFLKNTPGAWEELSKAAKDAVKGNYKAGAARLSKIDKQALKFEEKQSASSQRRARRGI